ncbi:MAG TPA: TetR/AcrR family transcriptional regulator, partial [Sorangium sp.]|nr:TetR/AcrR family transcriptional regulator [Sorangium sp.]
MKLQDKHTRDGRAGKTRRVRRSPEEARSHILAAARRVFAVQGPDAVGLKEVAREARVSHGLITHYFGRYEALVEAVLEEAAWRTQMRIVERLRDPGEHSIEAVIEIFF